jgi:DNA-binding transcriptional LysR family regulator
MSQPPLSEAIRKLEHELGVQLLQRSSRSVVPTPAGRAFAEEARAVLGALDLAVAEARRAGGASSTVRVGSLPSVGLDKLQRFLRALSSREPNLRTEVTQLSSMEQVRRLGSHELDIGLLHLAVPYAGIQTEPLFEGEDVAALIPTDHPLASKPALEPPDVRGEVLVVLSRTLNPALYDWWVSTIEQAGFRFGDVYEVQSNDPRDVVVAVANGNGISLGTAAYVAVAQASEIVACRPLAAPVTGPEIGVAWKGNGPRNVRGLIDVVREVARELR